MITITRRMDFDSAHRVLGHEGKCKHLHGHRYVAEVTVRTPNLDSLGRVIDFGVVKEKIGGWIDQFWDHNILLHPDDPLLLVSGQGLTPDLIGRAPFIMPHSGPNPTAENIARVLFYKSRSLLPTELTVVRVRIYETPNCWADFSE